MRPAAQAIVFVGILVAGCDTAFNVAHSGYRAVTAPVRFVRRAVDAPPQTTTTTTTTTSDVTEPGYPVVSPTPQPRVVTRSSTTATSRTSASKTPGTKTKPSAAPSSPQFPVAKAVPGKPGLVFNPFDPKGGYIDVSGYASGMKVKDPDSQKIFIVP